jgi:hypothetical protein
LKYKLKRHREGSFRYSAADKVFIFSNLFNLEIYFVLGRAQRNAKRFSAGVFKNFLIIFIKKILSYYPMLWAKCGGLRGWLETGGKEEV